jgi:catechol 2,3-dioxygenase-like lactoylglutathione lyase family enzyme
MYFIVFLLAVSRLCRRFSHVRRAAGADSDTRRRNRGEDVTVSSLGLVAVLVDDYDRGIAHYVDDLGFRLVENIDQGDKRWVVVAPPGTEDDPRATHLLLAEASDDEQRSRIGNQTGGRVVLFLHTDDFERDRSRMIAAGVEFLEEPRHEPYGVVAVFCDAFGNRWDLIQPTAST